MVADYQEFCTPEPKVSELNHGPPQPFCEASPMRKNTCMAINSSHAHIHTQMAQTIIREHTYVYTGITCTGSGTCFVHAFTSVRHVACATSSYRYV